MTAAKKAAVVLGVLLTLVASVLVFQRVAARGRFATAYSTYGSGPEGARGLYLLSERLGARPRRWSEDLARLPTRGMLVALGGCDAAMARRLSRYERKELRRWIDAGGVLLTAGARHYLPSGLGVRFARESRCKIVFDFLGSGDSDSDFGPEPGRAPSAVDEADAPAQPIDESPAAPTRGTRSDPAPGEPPDAAWRGAAAGADSGSTGAAEPDQGVFDTARADGASDDGGAIRWSLPVSEPLGGLDAISMRDPGRLVLDDGVAHKAVLRFANGVAGAVVTHGKGRVVVLASASMLQNGRLAAGDGGALFARILRAYAPAGPVLFDEFHLGVGEKRSTMRYLRQAGAAPLALQALFIVLLLLWRGGARFGGVRSEPERPPRGSASYVAAMGRLFARANDPGGALRLLQREALLRIAAHYRVPVSEPQTLARDLTERGCHEAAGAVRDIVRAVEKAGMEPSSLTWAGRRIDAALAQVFAEK